MKEISVNKIKSYIKEMFLQLNVIADPVIVGRLKEALNQSQSEQEAYALKALIENAAVAEKEKIPTCQDTGVAVVLLEIGQEILLVDGDLRNAIESGVQEAYQEGYFRMSVVADPLQRKNTGSNLPAMIHYEIVPGDQIKIQCLAKGGGSENCSALKMMSPSAGIQGIRDFVLETVEKSGPNGCPPFVVGIGIGGTFDFCALLAKKALFREFGNRHSDPLYKNLESELLSRINKLNIGPQGYGGACTALEVFVETMPCHIASMPVAVNMQCHASRHLTRVID